MISEAVHSRTHETRFDWTQGKYYVNVTVEDDSLTLGQIDIFYVTFKDDSGIIKEQEVKPGQSAQSPKGSQIYIPEGYYFAGWDSDLGNIQEDKIINATYESEVAYQRITEDRDDWMEAPGVILVEVYAEGHSLTVGAVPVYDHGYRISTPIPLYSIPEIQEADFVKIQKVADVDEDTNEITIKIAITNDGENIPSDEEWEEIEHRGVKDLPEDLEGKYLWTKQVLDTDDEDESPILYELKEIFAKKLENYEPE